MATEFRVCDEDRKQFGDEDTPEWVTFDREALNDIPFDVQHPWEREIKAQHPETSIVLLAGYEFATFSGLGIKGVVWLAWKMAGLETPRWKDFNIKTGKVQHRPAVTSVDVDPDEADGEDTDPPASGSTEPSSESAES